VPVSDSLPSFIILLKIILHLEVEVEMELSLVLQPKLVPVYDWHANPSEVWVVEVPLGAAQTLREYNSIHHKNSPAPQSIGILWFSKQVNALLFIHISS